eukprot:TRINITY_DN649_c0_g1_i3.p1 TRINITY_DN649_c0_g1~~TRINITY_DN649_c0_g1_i3.p1  ORF type:complete len:900 (+),score=214.98 TRINITY_DN649_c0_g1_i3:369-2702(+)
MKFDDEETPKPADTPAQEKPKEKNTIDDLSPKEKETLAETVKEQGNDYMKNKQYKEAIDKYTMAITLDPTKSAYFNNRSQAHLSLQQFDEALRDASSCLELEPTNTKAIFRKGVALFNLKSYSSALNTFQNGTSLPLAAAQKTEFKSYIEKCKDALKKLSDNASASKEISENDDMPTQIQKAMVAIDECCKNDNYQQAISILNQVISVDNANLTALLKAGSIYFEANKLDEALAYYTLAFKYHAENLTVQEKMGDVYHARQDYELAIKFYGSVINLAKEQKNTELETNMKIKIGKSFYAKGEKDTATAFWGNVLQANEEHFEGLYNYAIYLKDSDKRPDALRIVLNLLIKKSDHEGVREQLADLIKGPGGIDMLKDELKQVPSSAPALAFLATIIKDYGAIDESAQLYKDASTLKPDNTSYALNLVHGYELLNKYQVAFQTVKDFCRRNKQMHVSNVTCAQVYNCIAYMDSIEDFKSYKIGQDVIEAAKQKQTEKLTFNVPPVKPMTEDYNPEELDILALWCTLVKVLFAVGVLDILPDLIALINPVREGRAMHTTLIRNEHAYFMQIAQVMSSLPMPIPTNLPILYLAGDSHSMSSAWRTIEFKGQQHLIRPLLVTGLKAWHLRPESKFYPKYNFYNVVPQAPRGSNVIFLFGEIDCREGFIISVRKCRYKDLEEAASVTIKIYLQALKEMKEKYDWNIYIHPVAPVIDVTRPIVVTYNKILKEHVQKAPEFKWLDFFDDLVTDNQTKLNSLYDLDGTHLHPRYLSLVERALTQHD